MTGRPLEKRVQADVVHLLESLGAAIFVLGTRRKRGDWQGTMQSPGVPDLLVFMPRRGHADLELLMIEVKRQGGRLSPDQARFRALCESAGVQHITGDVDAVIHWLEDHRYLAGGRLAI